MRLDLTVHLTRVTHRPWSASCVLEEDAEAEAKAKAATKAAKQARKRERKKAAAAAAGSDAAEAASGGAGSPADGGTGLSAVDSPAPMTAPATAADVSTERTASPPQAHAAEPSSAAHRTGSPAAEQQQQQDRQPDSRSLPDWMLCPLTQEVMRDPAQLADGHSFERSAIEDWLLTRDTSPVTGLKLPHADLLANHALRNIIAAACTTAC